jgi:hypothetical protein
METKQNYACEVTKQNAISLLFGFAKQGKFRETVLNFLVSCFAKPKNKRKWKNLVPQLTDFMCHVDLSCKNTVLHFFQLILNAVL